MEKARFASNALSSLSYNDIPLKPIFPAEP
jgi:hypothetical protein